jgi:hypothetical protein
VGVISSVSREQLTRGVSSWLLFASVGSFVLLLFFTCAFVLFVLSRVARI